MSRHRDARNQRGEPCAPLFVSSFESWVTDPTVDEAQFSFELPPGAMEVDAATLLRQGAQDE